MVQVLEKPQTLLLKDIKQNPELITDILFKYKNVSLILEKQGEQVRLVYLKSYNDETIKLLEEIKQDHAIAKQQGYTSEQAFRDLMDARKTIKAYF